jgi:hypothetical protein
MEIRGLNLADLQVIASLFEIELREVNAVKRKSGPAYRLLLRPKGQRYKRLNHTLTRKVHAVCWHGHRDFMQAVFGWNPAAKILTCKARYLDATDFQNKFESTGYANIGSMMYPCFYKDACECGG